MTAKRLYEDDKAYGDHSHLLDALAGWVKGACFITKERPTEDSRLDVVLSADRYGDALLKQGDAATALEQYEISLAEARILAEELPSAVYCRNAAIMLRKVGKAHAKSDNYFGAKSCFREAIDFRQRVLSFSDTDADRKEIAIDQKELSNAEEELFKRYGIPKSQKEDTPPASEEAPAEEGKKKKPSFFRRLFGTKE